MYTKYHTYAQGFAACLSPYTHTTHSKSSAIQSSCLSEQNRCTCCALFVWVNDWHFKRIAQNDIHHHTLSNCRTRIHTHFMPLSSERYIYDTFALWLYGSSIINHSASTEWGYVVIIAFNYLDINQLGYPNKMFLLQSQEKHQLDWIAEKKFNRTNLLKCCRWWNGNDICYTKNSDKSEISIDSLFPPMYDRE